MFCGFFIFNSSAVFAATITSTATGGVWATGSTWVGGVAPATTDSAIIATTGANSVTLGVATTIAGLTINSGSKLSTSVNNYALTLNGNFTNNGTFTAGASAITIGGTGTQSIAGFTTTGTVSMTKAAGVATFTGNVNGAGLTINGSGGTLNLGAGLIHTFTGIVTLTAGTLNGGSSTLKENAISASAWNGNGLLFDPGTGTVNFGAGGNQFISATNPRFYNLTLSSSGIGGISIPSGTAVSNLFAVASGAKVYLAASAVVSANSLTLGGINKASGTWGGTGSGATHINSTYFYSTTGKLNVATGPTPTISGVTASQTIPPGTVSITLGGTVSVTGPVYPANGEFVTVTINGSTQNATIAGGAGGFSVVFPTSTIPSSAAPYTITYSYNGNDNLGAASNVSTTLTVKTIVPVITGITSVAGDASDPYYDTTDNSSTVVVYTVADATVCKWNATDVAYDSMSNTCASTSSCTLNLSGEGSKTIYMRCADSAGNKATSSYTLNYTIDATLPSQQGWSPANNSVITTATPIVTLNTNERGDCYATTTDWGYDQMYTNTHVDCAEDGPGTTHICNFASLNLGSAGTKNIYISCADYPAGNKDTSATNTKLTYTLTILSGCTSSCWVYYDGGAGTITQSSAIQYQYSFAHPAPRPSFEVTPLIAALPAGGSALVNFTDKSTCYTYSGGNLSSYDCKTDVVNSYSWDFDDTNNTNACTSPNVCHSYTVVDTYSPTLKITDDIGFCISDGTATVKVKKPSNVPEWKEITPF